jgi:WD40 repeat protein
MNRRPITVAIVSLLLSVTALAADAPTSRPALVPDARAHPPKLPPGALFRLGDLRFDDIGSRGGFFSTDGKRLISCGDDLVVRDAATGWEIYRLKASDHLMAHAAYFDTDQIAVACNASAPEKSGDIIIFNEKTGNLVRKIDRPWTGTFSELTASGDGSRFAVVTDHILLCDGQTGQTIRDLGAQPARTPRNGMLFNPRIAFSGDGKTFVAVTFDGEAHVIEPSTGQDKLDHTFTATLGANISFDGKTLATLPDDRDLHLFDLPSGDELPLPPLEVVFQPGQPAVRLSVMRTMFARRSGMLAYTSSGPGVNLVDTSERPLKDPRRIEPMNSFAGSPILSDDGSLLAISRGLIGRRIILDTQTSKPVTPASVSMSFITEMTASPDGKEVLVGNSEGELFRWDLHQGELLVHRDHTTATDFARSGIFRLSYFDDGQSVIENGDRICNPKTLATLHRLGSEPLAYQMGVRGQPRIVCTADARWFVETVDGDLVLTDRKTNTTTTLLHQTQLDQRRAFYPVAISPDATMLYGRGPGPRFMDLITRKIGPEIRTPFMSSSSLSALQFSPDSRWLTFQFFHTQAMFDAHQLVDAPLPDPNKPPQMPVVNGRIVQTTEPTFPVDTLWTRQCTSLFDADASFSPSSELVAMIADHDSNREVSVIEVRSGKPILTLPPTAPQATHVRFVAGRPQLLTADRAGTVLLWDLRTVFLAGKDLQAEKAEPDEHLWNALTDPDPVTAYRAGLVLLDHRQLARRAATLSPLPNTNIRSGTSKIHAMIEALSSPVPADREKAHKSLEGAGSAAIAEIRAALELHPEGELQDRLKDIARVIGADDPSVPTPPSLPSTAPVADADTLRTARVIQLLEWSDEPNAATQRARLTAPADAK